MSAHPKLRPPTAVLLCVGLLVLGTPAGAAAAVSQRAPSAQAAASDRGTSLEDAAQRAQHTGRTVAMQLIALGMAIAGIVLALKRDFKEAVGVFAVGILAVLMATPSGLNLLRDTVAALFGG